MVPTLTSNTGSDGGSVIGSVDYGGGYAKWTVFDGNTSTLGSARPTDNEYWIGYDFVCPVCIKGLKEVYYGLNTHNAVPIYVQGSNDCEDWTTVYEFINPTTKADFEVNYHTINNNESFRYWRVYANQAPDSDASTGCMPYYELQFYGVEKWYPKGLVPVMTSNTAPYGEASCDSVYDSRYSAYQAFDNGIDTYWVPADQKAGAWLSYRFNNPTIVTKFKLHLVQGVNPAVIPIYVQASNDNSNWVDLDAFDSINGVIEHDIENTTPYIYYRIYSSGMFSQYSTGYYKVDTLQFYGRQLEALVPPMTSNTAPVGEASAGSTNSQSGAWKAFDGATNTAWGGAEAVDNGGSKTNWIQYKFAKSTLVKSMTILFGDPSIATKMQIIGWNSDSDNKIIKEIVANMDGTKTYYLDLSENETKYNAIRLNITQKNTYSQASYMPQVRCIQFYGAPDYDSRTYIYDHGVELMEVQKAYNRNGAAGTVIKHSDYVYIKGSTDITAGNDCGISPVEQIDASPYSILCSVSSDGCGDTNGIFGYLMVVKGSSTPYNSDGGDCLASYSFNSISNRAVLDISNINQSVTPVVSNAWGAFLNVTEFWLE